MLHHVITKCLCQCIIGEHLGGAAEGVSRHLVQPAWGNVWKFGTK